MTEQLILKNFGFVGFGLIGGSIAHAISNSGDDEELIYSLKCGAYVPGGGAVG